MAENLDLLNAGIRKAIIDQINGEENKQRRAESLKAFEIYKGRQHKFVIDKLQEEFSTKTVQEMRKITSINLCPRIVNEQASVYGTAPKRTYANASEEQAALINIMYEVAKVDVKLMQSNRYYKLMNQCAVQVVPRDGKISVRVLMPHQYDVIPDANDPERAFCYIVSVFDKYQYLSPGNADASNVSRNDSPSGTRYNDGWNQDIADQEDYKSSLARYEVWTSEYNFIMDGKGNILSEDVVNPILALPFADVCMEKDFEYWMREVNSVVRFSTDFSAQLSDLANIIRLQGYAQAVMSGEKMPESMTIGPNHVLWLQLDSNRPEMKPEFAFVNPGSDLSASIEFLETTLRLFLTANGIDPKTVSGKGEGQSFSSGIERLLSLVDRFQASKSDIELFRWVEKQIFILMVKWLNAYQGTGLLVPELNGIQIPDDVTLDIAFEEPQAIQTQSEKEDSVIKLLDKGLITRESALMEVHSIGLDAAQEMLAKLDKEKELTVTVNAVNDPVVNVEADN